MSHFPSADPAARRPRGNLCLLAALVVAAIAVGGSLTLSLGLKLVACPLCFYQRAFALSVLGVLLLGLASGMGRTGPLALLALVPSMAGLGVAGFHVWLELSGKLECPAGVFGAGSAPQQSLIVFAILTLALVADAGLKATSAVSWASLAGAIGVGVLAAIASCVANPPLPAPPAQPYDRPATVCRPPYRTLEQAP